MDHLPFGEDAGVVGESEKHRFTSYERDAESGTDYAINRQYAINTGRFMQPDLYNQSTYLTNPQTINLYTYGWNDSINKIDPSGLDSLLFDGCKLTRLDDNGKPIQSWDAVSGKPGTTAADQAKQDVGPLPEGTYTANPADSQYRFDTKFYIYNPVNPSGVRVYSHPLWATSENMRIAWGNYRTELRAEPGTNTYGRSGFFIHGGDVPGSAGCIDLTGQNDAFHLFLKSYGKPIKVIVKYTCNPWQRGANQPRGSGGGGIFFIFSGSGTPFWYRALQDFLRWLDSIPVGKSPEGEHLA
jgi:RHS repeat-associated protein